MMPRYFVRMTDKFMSGWGHAAGKVNVFCVACDTHAQAVAVAKAAEERSEMKRVRVTGSAPKNSGGTLVSLRHFSELGGPWLTYYTAEEVTV